MSKFYVGIDIARGDDFTCFTVMRRANWFEKLLRWLRLSRAKWEWKIVDVKYEPDTRDVRPCPSCFAAIMGNGQCPNCHKR